MKTEQRLFDPTNGWKCCTGDLGGRQPQLVLVFGGRFQLEDPPMFGALRKTYPGARLIFGSTAGQIADGVVSEDRITATALAFDRTHVACTSISVRSQFESRAAGCTLAERLRGNDLVHVFVVSDGQLVNGTELARGLSEKLGREITITGGLAGDGERFEETRVGLDEAPLSGRIVAVGFYGKQLQVGFGSSGGWTPEGPEQTVTSAEGNILFQLDSRPALDLYSRYLGDQAAGLPASALRFPLCVMPPDGSPAIVRTILAVESSTRSMVFAGDIPLGSRVRFMRAAHDDLIAGAAHAAELAALSPAAELAICVSCVGRRLVLGSRTNEEIAAVRRILGPAPLLTGFYSYGELAPAGADTGCQLHNQTMTITTFRER
jgi:hypothetical protein